jgi:hypothetical protein
MSSWSGGSSFTSLPSWQDSFNTKLPSSLSNTTSGGGMFDPLSLGLGLGSSVIGGLFGMGQAKTSASIAQAQLDAQKHALEVAGQQNKLAFAGSLFNKSFDAGTGGDIAFGREKAGKEFLVGPYANDLMRLNSEASARERRAAISPESKERAQFENRLAIERETAARRAQTDAMFGPISSSYRA